MVAKLKIRMQMMKGNQTWNQISHKKSKYKEQQGLADGDTTPSDFDANDSDLDSSGSDVSAQSV